MFVSCTYKNSDECHKVLTFENHSNKKLYVDYGTYPLTLLETNHTNPLLHSSETKVEPFETNNSILSGSTCLEQYYKTISSGKTTYFVFDAQVIEITPWETVKANEMYLKRYDLTLDDWKNNNWTITYP